MSHFLNSRHHSGHYICEADNGFGNSPVAKEVRLEVHRKFIFCPFVNLILFLSIPLWCHLQLFPLFQMLLMLKLSVVSCSLGREIILICHHGIIWEMNIGHMMWKKQDYWKIQHFRSGREEKLLCTVHSSPKAVVTWTRWVKAFHYSTIFTRTKAFLILV